MSEAYDNLARQFHRLGALRAASGMLQWDSAAMMPAGAAAGRAEQIAQLNLVCHEILTDPLIADLLDRAEASSSDTNPWNRANLREMRRAWRHATAVPPALVEALSRAVSDCEHYWREARHRNDFAGLKPKFERVLSLVRESAAAKAQAFGMSPYDALLDEYEPGLSALRIDALFGDLLPFLKDAFPRVIDRQAKEPPPLRPEGPFPVEAQRRLGLDFMAVLGFDFERGRLDVSHHPFTGGAPSDVRITTRYHEGDFLRGLMGVWHETGHALYEQGLPEAWALQPVGQAPGMVLHESQSLLIEMQVCRSDAFLGFAAPRIAEAFGGRGKAWEPGNLARHSRRVARSLIRVDADEVSYPLHVILRYRLERAMIAGELTIADLPGAWNEAMRELVGIAPPDDKDGCLQDIHWPGGAFGYFPTYTLGALAAAQLFAAASRAEASISAGIAKGDFKPLLAWLRANIHGRGHLERTDALLAAATGAPLGTDAFKAHIARRYLS